MTFDERAVALRDGRRCTLRSPREDDAAAMLAFLRRTAGETDFLNSYPEDIVMTEEQERAFLRNDVADPLRLMLLAEADGLIVATCDLGPVNPRPKLRHRCILGIALIKDWWGRGLGDLLFRTALEQARTMGYTQIELDVYEPNARARALYEKYGFEVWGRTPNAARLRDGTVMTDLHMGRPL